MIFRSARFRKPLALFPLILSVALSHAAPPNAEEILASARLNPAGQHMVLDASLKGDRTKTPFTITVADGAVRYSFQDPEQELILKIDDNGPVLSERSGGKTAPVRPARFDENVRNSGLTFEDLTFRFLYWKNPKLIGDEQLVTGPAWKLELQAPRDSQYGAVRLWIGKDNGALFKVEGYDKKGVLLRDFQVIQVQKLGDQWMLKNMRVRLKNPETNKTSISYLDILGRRE